MSEQESQRRNGNEKHQNIFDRLVRARPSGTQVNFAYLLATVDGVLGRFELDLQPTTDNFFKVRVAQ